MESQIFFRQINLEQGPRTRGGRGGLSPPTFWDLLNGSLPQIVQKCNKKLHEKKVPPWAPSLFRWLRGPWPIPNSKFWKIDNNRVLSIFAKLSPREKTSQKWLVSCPRKAAWWKADCQKSATIANFLKRIPQKMIFDSYATIAFSNLYLKWKIAK